MSNSFKADSDHDYVFIDTEVTIGKSYKSRGWALSRSDIEEWIPVQVFERKCHVCINNITSEAKLRFNPRLFYESDELSEYLEELYDKGYSREKIPMRIKIPKINLYKNLENVDAYSGESIDTNLLVGKSYSSGGWQLSREVVSYLFPSNEYLEEYLICIGNIVSKAKLNLQFRLFYKSNVLSEYLEELYYENPRQKVDAKIIFEINSNPTSTSNEEEEYKISEQTDSHVKSNECICDVCGNPYFLSKDEKSKLCSECLEKITALTNFYTIKNNSLSNFVRKEFIEEIFGDNFSEYWDLLLKYDFLTPLGELFKLNGNESIEQIYSKYLSNSSDKVYKKRNKRKIFELINESKESERNKCNVCGVFLKEYEVDKCESCMDKQLAIDYLRDIVTKVPYKKVFSKYDLIDMVEISSLDANLILEKLLKYDLLILESDIFYKLNDVSFLNEFIEKYSNLSYELQVNYESDSSSIPSLSKYDLASEERIDSLIRWIDYNDFISFKKGQYGFMTVQFKQDGIFLYSKGFGTSYEAKVQAIKYLKSLGKLNLIDNEDIRLIIK